MSRLADDIAFLQRAADIAGVVIYPGGGNKTFAAGNITASPETMRQLADEMAAGYARAQADATSSDRKQRMEVGRELSDINGVNGRIQDIKDGYSLIRDLYAQLWLRTNRPYALRPVLAHYDYTIDAWVDAPGVEYQPVDGEFELLPGLRLVPAPGHTRGLQVVVVETGGRPIVVGGDVAVSHGELDEPSTEGQRVVRALDPELVWLAHEHEPWRPARRG